MNPPALQSSRVRVNCLLWVLSGAGVYVFTVMTALTQGVFGWDPKWHPLLIPLVLCLGGAFALMIYVARRTRGRISLVVSLVICLLIPVILLLPEVIEEVLGLNATSQEEPVLKSLTVGEPIPLWALLLFGAAALAPLVIWMIWPLRYLLGSFRQQDEQGADD